MQARRIALEILLRVEVDHAFADVLLGHRLAELNRPADRGLATQLVLGTLAWQRRLDYELARLSSRKLTELDPRVRAILRMGLHQLRQLTRIPAHAAVDTAVRLAGETRRRNGARGFVNAILRAAARSPAPMPDRARDEMGYLAVTHSHPRWLVKKFVDWFGVAEAETIMAANNLTAPNVLRLNLRRGAADELAARLGRDAIVISRGGLFPETLIVDRTASVDCDSFRAGLFAQQAEASQLVARLLAPPPGAIVIDCAAAPGGKSTHLAELVGPDGRVVALDLNLAGLKQTRGIAARLQHDHVHVARCDSSQSLPIRQRSVSYVLLDAPCTGLGTLREHPEIRWRLAPHDFTRMAHLQRAMLEQAATLLTPNGILVYAVCSLAPEEGAGVVNDFLAQHSEFVIDRPSASPLSELIDANGFLRTRPDRAARDAFFAARLRRLA